MVSRVPPPKDGSQPRTSSAVALLLVLLVVLGIWLINGRDPGTGTSAPPDSASDSFSPSSAPSSSVAPSERPSVRPSAQPAEVTVDPDSGLVLVDLADLPPEASDTVELIDRGPPYPYAQDGSTFGNFEGILPDRERGYYEEFTVVTPGSGDRGARRIVAGDEGELYWTEDHYDSFERISR